MDTDSDTSERQQWPAVGRHAEERTTNILGTTVVQTIYEHNHREVNMNSESKVEGKVACLQEVNKMTEFGESGNIEFEDGELDNDGEDNAAGRKTPALPMNDDDLELEEGEIREMDSPVQTSKSSKVKALCSFYQKGACTRASKCQFLHLKLNPSGRGNYQMFDTPPLAQVNKENQHWMQQGESVGLVKPRWNDYSNLQVDRFGRKLRGDQQHAGGWLPPPFMGVSPPMCVTVRPFHPWARRDAQTKSRSGSNGEYRSYKRSRAFMKSPYRRSRARSHSRSCSPLSPRSFKKSRTHNLSKPVSRSSSSRSRSPLSPRSCKKSRTRTLSSPHTRSPRSPLSPRSCKKSRTSSPQSRSYSSSSRSPSPPGPRSCLRSKSYETSRSRSQSSHGSRSCSSYSCSSDSTKSPSPHRPRSRLKSKSCRKSRHRSKSRSSASKSSSPVVPRSCSKSRSRSLSRSRSRSSSVSSTSSGGSCSSSSSTLSKCSADDISRNSDFDGVASTEQHSRDDASAQLSRLPASSSVSSDISTLLSSCSTKLQTSSPDSGLSSDVSTRPSSCSTKHSVPKDSCSSAPGASATSVNITSSSQVIPASKPGVRAEGASMDIENKLCAYQSPSFGGSIVMERIKNLTDKPSKEDLLKKLDKVNAKIAKMKAKKTGA